MCAAVPPTISHRFPFTALLQLSYCPLLPPFLGLVVALFGSLHAGLMVVSARLFLNRYFRNFQIPPSFPNFLHNPSCYSYHRPDTLLLPYSCVCCCPIFNYLWLLASIPIYCALCSRPICIRLSRNCQRTESFLDHLYLRITRVLDNLPTVATIVPVPCNCPIDNNSRTPQLTCPISK